jgi:GTP-binding protein HflX
VALIERAVREKIVLVGVTIPPDSTDDTENSLDELALLVDTAGADEVGRITQRRDAPDPPTYVGKGKAEELRELAVATDCDTVVFDNELTPAQQFNLEKLLGRTAIDRTAVILDIFAQNAHSQEGKAQVELAQLRYRLPRLRRQAGALSQQAGGMSAAGGASAPAARARPSSRSIAGASCAASTSWSPISRRSTATARRSARRSAGASSTRR